MARPAAHRDFAIALRLLGEYELSHAEAWRQLVPVAIRLGLPRPSYSTVRRLRLAHARRAVRAALATVVGAFAAGAAAAHMAPTPRRKALRRRRAIRLRE